MYCSTNGKLDYCGMAYSLNDKSCIFSHFSHTQRVGACDVRSGKQSAKRLIALAVCVFFIAASLLSAVFILTHANHTHNHNGPNGSCATCARLAAAENLLKTISAAPVGAALIYGALPAVLSVLKSVGFQTGLYALVRLKVRLNN